MSEVSLPLPLSHSPTFCLFAFVVCNISSFWGVAYWVLTQGDKWALRKESLLVLMFNVDSGVHCSVKSVCISCLT